MAANCGYGDAPQGRKLLYHYGPNVEVHIGLDLTWTSDQRRAPRAERSNLKALIDTGAQDSCIDGALAIEIGLPVIDKRHVGGVGSLIVDVHHAQVHVPRLLYTIHGPFAAIPGLIDRIHYPVVLGRTFLRDCLLTYDGRTGNASIAFTPVTAPA
jgi:hypothetical protein